jgi:excisionase family DNA binding protein
MPKTLYTTGQAAKLLGVYRKTVYLWCVKGTIDAYRTSPGGEWRITRDTLEKYAESNGIPLEEEEESN